MEAVVVVLLLGSLLVPGSQQQCISANDSFNDFSLDKLTELSKSQQKFSIRMLRLLALAEPKRNVMVSTYSVYQGLLLLYFGAAGKTEKALSTVLSVPDAKNKIDAFELYREEKYQIAKKYNFFMRNANRLFVSNEFKVRECLLQKIPSDIQSVNFTRYPQRIKKTITSWMDRETSRNMKSVVANLSPSSSMILVNAAYFRGEWDTAFNFGEIRPEHFFITPSQRVLTSMLIHKRNDSITFKTYTGKLYRILELPFKNKDNSMIILLPTVHTPGDVNQMIKTINRDFLTLISDPKQFKAESLEVRIPKFTAQNTVHLSQILRFMGIGDGLTINADYSRFTGKRDVFLDSFIHQALLEFQVARAPLLGTKKPSSTVSPPNSFICNRPFVYVIYDKMVKKILNIGIFRVARTNQRPSQT